VILNGDYVTFGRELEDAISSIEKREPKTESKRIGYIGVRLLTQIYMNLLNLLMPGGI